MANFTRKTITLSDRKIVNGAQKIQRDYYNKIREMLATASDAQIDTIEKAFGADDTQAAFAIQQEREARTAGLLGFTVFEKEPVVEVDAHDAPGLSEDIFAITGDGEISAEDGFGLHLH